MGVCALLSIDSTNIQLRSALRDRPDLVLDMVTELLQGRLGVAQIKHLTTALQALSNDPKETKRVFELASERNMVTFLFFALVVPFVFASSKVKQCRWLCGARLFSNARIFSVP